MKKSLEGIACTATLITALGTAADCGPSSRVTRIDCSDQPGQCRDWPAMDSGAAVGEKARPDNQAQIDAENKDFCQHNPGQCENGKRK